MFPAKFLPAVVPWVSQWGTPLWLLAAGVTVGVLVLAILGGLASLFSRTVRGELLLAVREGVLWPLAVIAGVLAAFTLLGLFVVEDPQVMLYSLRKMPSAGVRSFNFDVAPARTNPNDVLETPKVQEVTINIPRNEMRLMVFQANENVEVLTAPPAAAPNAGARFEVPAGQAVPLIPAPETFLMVFPNELIDKLYIYNYGAKTAKLDLYVTILPPAPEVVAIPVAAVAVIVLVGLYLLQRTVAPKASAVALASFKSETAQPFFVILSLIGVVALAMFEFIPYNTFGEDIKMLKDSGLHLIKVLAILQAVWAASTSIAEEVEGKTALTVLSKPIGRREFIVGKFLGIVWTLVLLFVILSAVFLIVVAYKPIHESREGGAAEVTWQLCYHEMTGIVPGLVLAFMETIMLAAVSVAISTRLPLMANFVISFAIYVLGNLVPLIVQSGAGRFEIVKFFGQLIGVVFPNLESFSAEAAIAAGKAVPMAYLGGAGLYCLNYTLIAMLLALILFEDRDLA